MVMPYAAESNFDLVDVLKEWHVTLANLGYFMIGLHALAALMHHYFWKDNTLLRMMPKKPDPMIFMPCGELQGILHV
jgi:cytochrome b561